MPALLARSSDLARKALMTSGPAQMFSQFDTLNGRSRPASRNWICWTFWYEAIFRLVPAGTLRASGADEAPFVSAAALPFAQPLSPATPAAAPAREVRKSRRPTPGTGDGDMGELHGSR